MPRFLFRPRWIAFHLLVVVAVVAMVNLGFWQLRRLDERRTDNAQLEARMSQPVVDLTELLDDVRTDPDAVENRSVRVGGTYLDTQFVLFNRSLNGRAVDNVLTPLAIDGEDLSILVNRGAIAVQSTPPAPPTVGVEIVGRLRPSQQRDRGGLTDADTGAITEVRRVDLQTLADEVPGDLAPMYLELEASAPDVTATDPELLPPPTPTEGNHLSYAVQWFIFSLCVAVGWVLAVRRSIRVRKAEALGRGPEDLLATARGESSTMSGRTPSP